jgi:glyoxylase-like metal-dependent hydrolase (beta-lactamase superfamily II)
MATPAPVQWNVGDVRITKVVEHELPIPLNGLLVDVADEVIARNQWLAPDFSTPEGLGKLSIHALVIDTGEHRILVDTCVGNLREGLHMPPTPSDLPASLAAAGYAVEDIDTVICTHLHFDHVGWNTRLEGGKWVVTFPNARYLIGRDEWAHWQVTDGAYSNNLSDTISPVIDAGAVDFVETDHQVCPQVRLTPTPGHTPGHVSVVIESGQGDNIERAFITGDMAHHPIQFAEPDIAAPADSDSPLAAQTRRSFLTDRAADQALVIGTHFGGPTAGRVVAMGDAWRLIP